MLYLHTGCTGCGRRVNCSFWSSTERLQWCSNSAAASKINRQWAWSAGIETGARSSPGMGIWLSSEHRFWQHIVAATRVHTCKTDQVHAKHMLLIGKGAFPSSSPEQRLFCMCVCVYVWLVYVSYFGSSLCCLCILRTSLCWILGGDYFPGSLPLLILS